MAKILHEGLGIRVKKNDKNGFCVVTLHYTADPRKRSKAWLIEAKQGMAPAKFEQEYEISYTAMMGEKVFPEIKTRKKEIICTCPFEDGEWPAHLAMWGGFDYGARNPSSFHVYTVWDGVVFAIWELYEPCKNILEFTKQMKACPYWNQIRYIMCDPDMGNLKQRNMTTGEATCVLQQFIEVGINKLVPGSQDEAGWLGLMRKHWGEEEVTFRIQENCSNMIREFEEATFVVMSDKQLETQNYREAMVDKHNHALDDCKYFMNSAPNVKARKLTLPVLVKRFHNW